MSEFIETLPYRIQSLENKYEDHEERLSNIEIKQCVQEEKNNSSEKTDVTIEKRMDRIDHRLSFISNWMIFSTGGAIILAALAFILKILKVY